MQILGLALTVATLIVTGLALAAPNPSLGQWATLVAVTCQIIALLCFYKSTTDRKQ